MADNRKPDFSGWATAYNQKCSDGRTIKPGAFKHMDGQTVPLVWMHQHNDPENLLGHAKLQDRAFGTYTEAWFNETERGQHVKAAVIHGDVGTLSIYATGLSERKLKDGKEVYHGDIKEVSVVLAGANPGALIENINIIHGDSFETIDEEAIIYTGLELEHSDITEEENEVVNETTDTLEHADKTVQDVVDSMSEEQKNVLYYLVGEAASGDGEAEHDGLSTEDFLAHIDTQIKEGFTAMGNVFDQTDAEQTKGGKPVLSHADVSAIMKRASKVGSLREVMEEGLEGVIAHAGVDGVDYGINAINTLFPDAQALDSSPQFIKRRTEWVAKVLDGTKHVPFAKVKSVVADITAEEARARGYVKGTMKKEEVIKLLKRTTSPTTIYKKQRLDRDDIIDIKDFDVVVWLKAEMRLMLEEELARAILIGDGRSSSNPDKIKDPEGAIDGNGIRSIVNDSDMYIVDVELATNVKPADEIKAVIRARSQYRGSGSPTMFTTDAAVTDYLLLEDKVGRPLYDTEASISNKLRVKELVPVEVLEETEDVRAIIVNLQDYTIGTNQGGDLTFFDDFDIDFNQEKYLLETRLSGALTRPKSAIVIRRKAGTAATPAQPSYNPATHVITIPNTTGINYEINDEVVSGNVTITDDAEVTASPKADFYIPSGATRSWSFAF